MQWENGSSFKVGHRTYKFCIMSDSRTIRSRYKELIRKGFTHAEAQSFMKEVFDICHYMKQVDK